MFAKCTGTTTPGTRPYAFTGGTIRQAIVDVSGEPLLDLELEAAKMMAREQRVPGA